MICGRMKRQYFFVLAASLLGYAVFAIVDWDPIQVSIAKSASICLSAIGEKALFLDKYVVLEEFEDPSIFEITRECTYLDWYFIVLPFIWRKITLAMNVIRSIVLLIGVYFFNLFRICFGISLASHGVEWWWAHDFVDFISYYPALIIVVLLWVKNLYKSVAQPDLSTKDHHPPLANTDVACQSRR